MKITKKVCIYILVGLITVTGTFTSFYKGAYAFEYVGGALAFEEAIKWLLASVGIISAGGMTADYWENHSQEFEDYCTQQNITDTEVANWQLKLCEGVLDKGSECWQAFKEWASTLTDSSSGGGSVPNSVTSDVALDIINNYLGTSFSSFANNNFDQIYGIFIVKPTSDYSYFNIFLNVASSSSSASLSGSTLVLNGSLVRIFSNASSGVLSYVSNTPNNQSISLSNYSGNYSFGVYNFDLVGISSYDNITPSSGSITSFDNFNSIAEYLGLKQLSNNITFNNDFCCIYYKLNVTNKYQLYLFYSNDGAVSGTFNSDGYFINSISNTRYIDSSPTYSSDNPLSGRWSNTLLNVATDIHYYNFNNVDSFSGEISGVLPFGDSSSDSDFISVQSDVTDLDIISSPIPDTDAQEVAIPMPGVTDSDNEASAEAYDNIVDQVNDGTLELDDAITQVIDTLKIIVYEQETEKIFPKPENEEDQEDLDDKINENKDNMGFTLGGLETVFPFCIPWDIYAFINLLRADPVPPKIELPFPNPLDPENPWIVEVDFSDWDDGMKIVRLAEDFLFIIGLAVLTRSLIGAGGGDG